MHTISSLFIRRITPLIALALCFATLPPAPARAAGYTLHTLYAFSATSANGHNPDGAMPDSRITLDGQGHGYGTAGNGGAHGDGTVFEYDFASGTFTVLATFNGTNGSFPYGGVALDGNGFLYGTTISGGTHSHGTIFKINLATNTLTTLFNFNGTNGDFPEGVTLDGQGHLYGNTYQGGSHYDGTIFKFNLSANTLATLYTFKNDSNERNPIGGVAWDGQGHLYGATEPTRSGTPPTQGTVYKFTLATGALTTLVVFNGTNGNAYPDTAVVLDGQGHLYGSTIGGTGSSGTLFEYNLAAKTLTTLFRFNGSNGDSTEAITLDGQGHLFGMNFDGGASNDGTLFKFNLSTKTLSTLVVFNGANGANPQFGLTLDSSGNLYGTAGGGGANGNGTVYELTPNP